MPIKKRKICIRPIIVGIIIFPLSLFMDVLMGKKIDYSYALVLTILVGIIFFALEYIMNYRISKKI